MTLESIDTEEKIVGKKLYDYQLDAIDKIFTRLRKHDNQYNLLYQLPTGGGKTVIFTEITKQYIKEFGKKVMILTHRVELCAQTSKMLSEFGISNKVINSKVKTMPDQDDYSCFVAMVETLNNRLQDGIFELSDIGLLIIDEAHYNSFRKLLKHFEGSFILGVTATPLSSNTKLPMKDNYQELIVGNSIADLIESKFLAKATTYSYDVNLSSLKIGINGDYTTASSDRLYSEFRMQEKLLKAYEEKAKGTKTLIFNNGINSSIYVEQSFKAAGIEVRHLDHKNSTEERSEILQWFKEKPDAVLTSVGILTTGFDEPTVETIILNRATKSLTLYHQMIGRGSRVLKDKKNFNVIDLGNNALRFGLWDAYVDWHAVFRTPELYIQNIVSDDEIQRHFKYVMPDEIRKRFSKSDDISFNVKEIYKSVVAQGLRPKVVIEKSIEHHAQMCVENEEDVYEARNLAKLLKGDIEYRIKLYSFCLHKSSDSYIKWLQEDYERKLRVRLNQLY